MSRAAPTETPAAPSSRAWTIGELSQLRHDREKLAGERNIIVERLERAEHAIRQLDSLAAYCEHVRRHLKAFDFASKRLALTALGIEVVVDRGLGGDAPWRVYSEFDPSTEFNPQTGIAI